MNMLDRDFNNFYYSVTNKKINIKFNYRNLTNIDFYDEYSDIIYLYCIWLCINNNDKLVYVIINKQSNIIKIRDRFLYFCDKLNIDDYQTNKVNISFTKLNSRIHFSIFNVSGFKGYSIDLLVIQDFHKIPSVVSKFFTDNYFTYFNNDDHKLICCGDNKSESLFSVWWEFEPILNNNFNVINKRINI